MSGVLLLGDTEIDAIRAAIARAIANPVPWEAMRAIVITNDTTMLPISDRPPGVASVRAKYPAQRVQLGSYDCAISFEYQPAGLLRHLSISSRAIGKIPGPHVLQMVAEAFGFDTTLAKAIGDPEHLTSRVAFRMWLEEFLPGHQAVNIVQVEP